MRERNKRHLYRTLCYCAIRCILTIRSRIYPYVLHLPPIILQKSRLKHQGTKSNKEQQK